MIRSIYITKANMVRWEQALAALSMERCQSFFGEMGLPHEMIEYPKGVIKHARNYLEKCHLQTGDFSVTPEIYATEVQHCLEDTFSRITADYDEENAHLLYAWFLRYVIDDDVATEALIWRNLFRRLCGIVGADELSVAPSIDQATINCICHIVDRYMPPEFLQEIHQRIETARVLPKSEWDEQLEEKVRYAAGEGNILGAIDMALGLVENIIANRQTIQAWDFLIGHISPDECEDLLTWARQQASALGIPDRAIRVLPFPTNSIV